MPSDRPESPATLVTMPSARDGRCPRCGDTATLRHCLWGLWAGDAIDRSTVHLGGCVIVGDTVPEFHCVACATDFDSAGQVLPPTPRSPAR